MKTAAVPDVLQYKHIPHTDPPLIKGHQSTTKRHFMFSSTSTQMFLSNVTVCSKHWVTIWDFKCFETCNRHFSPVRSVKCESYITTVLQHTLNTLKERWMIKYELWPTEVCVGPSPIMKHSRTAAANTTSCRLTRGFFTQFSTHSLPVFTECVC